ncbi:MAG: transglutaminase family protein [Gammaproteobacteria bacterium]|nr:transglutaminase family protein [Gammaproteobacteria bacterium]
MSTAALTSGNDPVNSYYESRRRVIAIVARILLIPFGWLAVGADAWPKMLMAEKDPAGFVKMMADSPRIQLHPQTMEQLRLWNVRSAVQRTSPRPQHPTHLERKAVIGNQVLASELRRLSNGRTLGKHERSSKIRRIRKELADHHRDILSGFSTVEGYFNSRSIAEEQFDRYQSHQTLYLEKWEWLKKQLDRAEHDADPTNQNRAIEAAIELLNTSHDQRPEQPFSTHKLPFAVSKPVGRMPRSDWNSASSQLEETSTGFVDSVLNYFVTPVEAGEPAVPADLEANEDVQLTEDIRNLAVSLNNNPLRILNWVRNNIDFNPTYGSVQGSQLTLEMKKGNATDISSLLIALLRSAGVPARYVMGTINMPVDDVINWLGEVPDADFAQQVLGSGGIANVAIVDGTGQTVSFDLEHVWVEAHVDMIPSRGVINKVGDTWIQMDASHKTYNVIPGSSFVSDMPMNPVIDSIQGSLTVDESLGQFSDIDEQATVGGLEDWIVSALDYMEVNGIEKTPAGILGGKSIDQKDLPSLPGTVPFEVKSSAQSVALLPAATRYTVEVTGYRSALYRSAGSPDFTTTVSLASLGSQRLGLTFDPATSGDEAVLQAARDSGSASLPLPSINVTPKIKVDDAVVATGNAIGMGRDYFLDVTLRGPDGSNTLPYNVIAGDEIVVGVTGNGFSPEVLQHRLDSHPVDHSAEYFHQINLHYWTETDFLNEISAKGAGGYIVRLPSVGLFSSPLTVTYLFGQPNTGVYASKFMDVKWSYIGAAGKTPEESTALVKQAGFNGSYMEGTTFDQFETTVDGTPRIKAIDSMKLLSAANAQGVPLYRITPSNRAQVIPLLNLDASVESNIAAALNAGQTVLAPQENISIGPWSGAGYILQNETTGEGAYLISGGLNGGGLADCVEELVKKFLSIVVIIALGIVAIILLYYLIAALAAALAGILAGITSAAEAWAAFIMMMRALAPLAV